MCQAREGRQSGNDGDKPPQLQHELMAPSSPPPSSGMGTKNSKADRGANANANANAGGEEKKNAALLQRGVSCGALSVALLVVSAAMVMPHYQSRLDELECDSMCYGSMTSVRSMLSLLGSAVMGRLSDSRSIPFLRGAGAARTFRLRVGVVASLMSMIIAVQTNSLSGLWISMIPSSLFQQNFSIMKALVSDYHNDYGSESDRASSVGMLGMAVGIAFMVGTMTGATLFSSFQQANVMGMGMLLLSGILITQLPDPKAHPPTGTAVAPKKAEKATPSGLLKFLNVRAARTPAAILFMVIRLCMGLAFHCFQTIWRSSLKSRFNFGPKDHGTFMSFIGLSYAVSQGFVAKFLLTSLGGNASPRRRVQMMMGCCMVLGVGRYMAYQTGNLIAVYVVFGFIVMALGLMNTILTADTSHVASSDEIGSLFGILGAVESGAGMIGPLLGGSLSLIDPILAPLGAVLALYAIVFAIIGWGYERLVLARSQNFFPPKEGGGAKGAPSAGSQGPPRAVPSMASETSSQPSEERKNL